jgi:hypothetical protein
MIIDARAVVVALKALAATLALWFAGMALLALFVEPPVVAAFGRAAPMLADPSLKIVAIRPGVVTVAGEGRGWVRRLYARGAWFVWPITASGCVGRFRLGR